MTERMEKDGRMKTRGGHRAGLRFLPAAVFAVLLAFASAPAMACENPINATATFNQLIRNIVFRINDFIEQEQNFIDDDISRTATDEVSVRIQEFDRNIRNGLSVWWRDHFLPNMKIMTAQLYTARVDQSRAVGALMDAQLQAEFARELNKREAEAQKRYRPNEMSCQIDSLGPAQTKAARLSGAFNRGLAYENTQRLNATGPDAVLTQVDENSRAWEEYKELFCNPDQGDVGCPAPGPLAGRNVDIPALLWGERQTIDLSQEENRRLVASAMRTLVSPQVLQPIPPDIVGTPEGQEELLARRAYIARVNTIYNVLGQMIAERVGGSGASVADMRVASGLPPGGASPDASYREIQQAMMKDRFRDPRYITRLVSDPVQLAREQGSINALRSQQLNDLYKRMEEMVLMEAAMFADELDGDMPEENGEFREIRPTP